MPTTRITAPVADGTARGELSTPDHATGRLPLIVLYPDAGGVRPAMTRNAERLAADGYAVLDVDTFWRAGEFAPFNWSTVWTDPTERARLGAIMGTVKLPNVLDDTRALMATLDPAAIDTSRIGTIGYCMGGRLAFLAAIERPELVVATAPIHAGALVTAAEDSPHKRVGSLRAAVYIGAADQDSSCTDEQRAALQAALAAAGVRHEVELHQGARHGFAVSDFPVYDEKADARHLEKALALFGAELRG